MLPSAFRLCRTKDFARVYRVKQIISDDTLVIYFAPNQRPSSRFAFVVNNKYGHAPARHQARRRLAEIVRLNLGQIRGGYDMILHVKKTLANADFWLLELGVLQLLRRRQLLTEGGQVQGHAKNTLPGFPGTLRRPD